MTDKRTDSYEMIFKYIEDNIFKFQAALFMADFEAGLRKAIMRYFPGVSIRGCWYHYSAAIRRRLMNLHMHRVITDDPVGWMIWRMFLSIPLLPQERILDGFNFIKKVARENHIFQEFKKFFRYFNDFWIKLVWLTIFLKIILGYYFCS